MRWWVCGARYPLDIEQDVCKGSRNEPLPTVGVDDVIIVKGLPAHMMTVAFRARPHKHLSPCPLVGTHTYEADNYPSITADTHTHT